MRTSLKGLAASTLAAATVVSGLSFGTAAAQADTHANPTVQVIFKAGSQFTTPSDGYRVGSVDFFQRTYPTLAQARAEGRTFDYVPTTDGYARFVEQDGTCLATAASTPIMYPGGECSGAYAEWRIVGKTLESRGGGVYGTIAKIGTVNGISTGAAEFQDQIAPVTAEVDSVDVASRSAVLSGTGLTGAQVFVNGTHEADVEDFRWTATASGLKLGKNTITIDQRTAGTVKDSTSVTVDITFTALDSRVEFGANPTDRAMVVGTAEPGAHIVAANAAGDEVGSGTADGKTGDFSFPVTAPNAGGPAQLTVSQRIGGELADSQKRTVDYGAAVDITSPKQDSSHASGKLTLQGTGEPDATVDVREQGDSFVIGTGTVSSTGAFTVQTRTDLDHLEHSLVVTQTGKGNNVTTDGVTVNPGIDIRDLTVTAPASGDTVTLPEDGSDEFPNAKVRFSGEGEPNAQVQVVTSGVVGSAKADNTGHWELDAALDFTTYASIDVVQTAGANVQTEQVQNLVVEREQKVVRELVVTTPQANSAVSAPAGNSADYPNAKVMFEGEGEPNAHIEVLRSNNKLGGTTTVDADGHWVAFVDANWTAYPWFTVKQTAGTDVKTEKIDNVTVIREGVSVPFSVTSPKADSTTVAPAGGTTAFPNAKLHVTGTGTVGSKIEFLRENGKVGGKTTVPADGNWALDADINWGKWNVSVVETKAADGAKTVIDLKNVNLVKDMPIEKPFAVTSPESGKDVAGPAGGGGKFPNARVTFTGTGQAGATVVIVRKHNMKEAGRGTVGTDGTFSIDADYNWGTWGAVVTQTSTAGDETVEVLGFSVIK